MLMSHADRGTGSAQNGLQNLAKIGHTVVFGQVAAETHFEKPLGHFIVVLATGDDSAHIRIEFVQFMKTFLAAHPTYHRDVNDDRIVGASNIEVALIEFDRFLSIMRDVEFVIETLQHGGGECADFFIIVHE